MCVCVCEGGGGSTSTLHMMPASLSGDNASLSGKIALTSFRTIEIDYGKDLAPRVEKVVYFLN